MAQDGSSESEVHKNIDLICLLLKISVPVDKYQRLKII
jgi:hypothetical protein